MSGKKANNPQIISRLGTGYRNWISKSVLHKFYTLHNLIYHRRMSTSLFNPLHKCSPQQRATERVFDRPGAEDCQRWIRYHNGQSHIQNNKPANHNPRGKKSPKPKAPHRINSPKQRSGKPLLHHLPGTLCTRTDRKSPSLRRV